MIGQQDRGHAPPGGLADVRDRLRANEPRGRQSILGHWGQVGGRGGQRYDDPG
jgi:hypothetical protein